MAKSNFIVRGGYDANEITKGLLKTQKQLGKFQDKTQKQLEKAQIKIENSSLKKLNKMQAKYQKTQSGLSKAIKGTLATLSSIAIGSFIKDSTSMAMAVESSTDNISRNMGQSSKAFEEWVNTQSKGLGIAKKDAYTYGSTFSNLLGSFQSSTKETADSTQELMKASAIIASKTGKTYDDVANRIRSGMLGSTEAIEDLGVYTNISMIESTNAFKKFANGKSWSQLDFKVQQQIRLAAILEQTYSRYGDTLANTTQTKQAVFLASLQNIRLNIGQAFLPIYNVVLPALTSLGNMLESLTSKLSAVSQAFFGKAISIQTSGIEDNTSAIADMGDATEKAGKQAKGAVAPFDELKQISIPSSKAGGSSGTGSTNTPTTSTTVTDEDSGFTKWLDKMKDNMNPTLEALGRLKEALKPLAKFTFKGIKSLYKDTLVPIGEWALGEGLPALIDACANLLKKIDWKKLTTSLTNFNKAIAPFAIALGGGLITFINQLSGILSPVIGTTLDTIAGGLDLLSDAINSLSPSTVNELGYALGSFFASLAIVSTLSGVGNILSGIGTGLSGLAAGMSSFTAINGFSLSIIFGNLVSDLDEWVTTTIGEKFGKVWENVLVIFANVGLGAVTGFSFGGVPGAIIGGLLGGLLAVVTTIDLSGFWNSFKKQLSDSLGTIFSWKETKILFKDMINNFKNVLDGKNIGENLINGLFNGINAAITFVFEPIINLFQSITNGVKKIFGIKSPSTVFYTIGGFLIQGLINGVKSLILKVPEDFKKLWADIQKVFANINTWFGGKFSSAYNAVTNAFKPFTSFFTGLGTSLKTTFNGSINAVIRMFNKFIGWVNDKLSFSWDGLNIAGKTIFEGGTVKLANIPNIPEIQGYATGGFPSAGELFFGNENGIEMMGRMGNKNVVANNNQIVAGIREGVAEGNIEQIALLKQQNSLLQGILQKTGISTKEIFNATRIEANEFADRTGKQAFVF